MDERNLMPSVALPAGNFFGAVPALWQTELVTLSVIHHPAAREVPEHGHEQMFLSLLLRGGYREWVGAREIEYRPMTLVFHPERLLHRDEITRPDSLFFAAELRHTLLDEGQRRQLRSVRELSGGPAVWTLLRVREALSRERRDAIECEEPLSEIVADLLSHTRSTAARPRWLNPVEELLRAEFRAPVSLAALAELAGVHPVHLSRVFRRHYGTSIRTHLHRLRVLHASALITGSGAALAEAALASGFCDQSHMNRVFVAVTGMTPASYRRAVHG